MECLLKLLQEIKIETRQHKVTIRVLGWISINLQEIGIETRQHKVTIRVLGWISINSVDRLINVLPHVFLFFVTHLEYV